MDVSGGILANLDAGNPCRHDDDLHFHVLRASVRHDTLRGENIFA